ncbi:MAG: right-handed parallel beta-helix repeat-containing protein [Dysgonomonas sp.]
MQLFVSANASQNGNGSRENPFQTIAMAANIAHAGDEVIVAPGVYREWVNPVNGGTSDECRIVYRSEKPLEAIITGAEIVKGWKHHDGNVWVVKIPNEMFGSYNPYCDEIQGDWYQPIKTLHTGEVYLNGRAMYEVASQDDVINPVEDKMSWEKDFSTHVWFTEQHENETVIYANFQGKEPNEETVEINVRKYCVHPEKTGVNYITLSGFVVTKAATQWAPPTAYQEGMIGPHWSKGWIIEDCDVSNSRCSGISLGKYLQPNNDNKWSKKLYKDGTQTERDAICQAQYEGWNKENIGSHIVRRCHIHDCGQTGIVGHLGGVFSIIEDNRIHNINSRQDLFGAEIGGIKMHAAIDVIYRRNHIHHCTRGLWLDWQAQGTRVTQNLFHDNNPPAGGGPLAAFNMGEDIFVEVSHGPTLIDNNILLSPCAAKVSTQGIAFVHNLIAGSFTQVGTGTENRYTPYHVPHRTEVAGFMTFMHGDARFLNNIFVQNKKYVAIEQMMSQIEFMKARGITFICGTHPFNDYPTAEQYFEKFKPVPNDTFAKIMGMMGGDPMQMDPQKIQQSIKDLLGTISTDKYFGRLPVYTGGNIYFNGARPCNIEENYLEDTVHDIELKLEEMEGNFVLKTNLFEHLPIAFDVKLISTETLGEAFEPEQKFENSDGSPIQFNLGYFGTLRNMITIPGPFIDACEISKTLIRHVSA